MQVIRNHSFTILFFSLSASIPDDSIPLNISNSNTSNNNNNHDYENTSGEDEGHTHHHHQQSSKSNIPIVDMDNYETSTSLLDPQMAAYRAIMSRMVPFGNNINGNSLPHRFVKQEPTLNPDDSSREDASISQSPSNDRLSP